ncbi:MAG: LysM peptidoglycan-binding domain-containing protein, partial [Bacteroidales bacterium]|nr:LysM peptidoglycan-binding domain-containing protein [Bacteroidales bacterium]
MKWIAFLVFILALNISLPGFSQSLDVERSSVIQEINGKSFYLHEVKKGETLSSIARAYEVKVSDIIGSNYGISENIQPGDIIKIQVKNNEHTGEAENKMNYRRVAKGETLYSLSQEYNVSIEEIKEANNGLPDGIKTDEFIKIPIKTASIQPSVAQKQQEKQNKDYFEYQAKEKISIYELAIKYRVSVDHILNLNPGLSEELISEEIIRIPIMASQTDFITHTVKSRQTMNRLARLYDIDIETIKAINPYISRHLSEGQVLRIPLPEQKPEDEIINKFVNDQDSLLTVETREKTIKEVCHDKYDMAEYDMALILPFFISEYDSIYRLYKNAKDQKPDPEFFKSFVFIQFYEGFLMAVDSMKNCGLNVKIHVFNLGDNIDQAKLLIKNPELKNM